MAAPQLVVPDATTGPLRPQGRTKGGRFARSSSLSRSVELTVTSRQRSPQESRQFDAAFDLLLSELVRQELVRARGAS